ncbi:MAG TPA: hypothetical protein VFW41_03535 [Gaiellaceae bacterium]|nr:hypothetical protein [Gaiellaceae bacterium]
MSVIEISAAQAAALAELASAHGLVAIHQVAPTGDLYVTPHNSSAGFRIAPDGAVSDIGQTLPAP